MSVNCDLAQEGVDKLKIEEQLIRIERDGGAYLGPHYQALYNVNEFVGFVFQT